jgi:hypothetical protein
MPTPNPHNAVGAWFLGPRAENFQHLKDIVNIVLGEQEKARKGYFSDDSDFITSEMQQSTEFTSKFWFCYRRLVTKIAVQPKLPSSKQLSRSYPWH